MEGKIVFFETGSITPKGKILSIHGKYDISENKFIRAERIAYGFERKGSVYKTKNHVPKTIIYPKVDIKNIDTWKASAKQEIINEIKSKI